MEFSRSPRSTWCSTSSSSCFRNLDTEEKGGRKEQIRGKGEKKRKKKELGRENTFHASYPAKSREWSSVIYWSLGRYLSNLESYGDAVAFAAFSRKVDTGFSACVWSKKIFLSREKKKKSFGRTVWLRCFNASSFDSSIGRNDLLEATIFTGSRSNWNVSKENLYCFHCSMHTRRWLVI